MTWLEILTWVMAVLSVVLSIAAIVVSSMAMRRITHSVQDTPPDQPD